MSEILAPSTADDPNTHAARSWAEFLAVPQAYTFRMRPAVTITVNLKAYVIQELKRRNGGSKNARPQFRLRLVRKSDACIVYDQQAFSNENTAIARITKAIDAQWEIDRLKRLNP